MNVEGTPYRIVVRPVFGSDRWRFEIYSGPAFVSASAGTYRSSMLAIENGVKYARALAAKLRKDLG